MIEELSLLTNELAEVKTSLRIGLTKTLNFNNIPILYNKISELLSDDELAIQRLNSEQLLRSLSKGQMDIVITGEKSLCSTYNYDFHWLYREPLLLAMPSSYVDPLKAKVSLKEVGDLPLFWFSRKENPVFYDKCEGYFSKLPYSIKRVKEPEDSLVMLSAIALGKGMALMPASMCTFTQEGLTYKPLIDEAQKVLNIDVYAVVSKSEEREHVLEGLNSLIDKV
nr:LysR family substrate-binding domain-containing protein [Vibrio sp. Of7-15]